MKKYVGFFAGSSLMCALLLALFTVAQQEHLYGRLRETPGTIAIECGIVGMALGFGLSVIVRGIADLRAINKKYDERGRRHA